MVVNVQVLPRLDVVSEAVRARRIRGEKVKAEVTTIEAVPDNIDGFRTGVLAEKPPTGEDHLQIPPGRLSGILDLPPEYICELTCQILFLDAERLCHLHLPSTPRAPTEVQAPESAQSSKADVERAPRQQASGPAGPSGALTSVPPGALTSEPPGASGAAGPSGALTASLPSANEHVRDVLTRGVCGAWLVGMLFELQLSEAVGASTWPNTRYRQALQGRRRRLTSSCFGGCFGSRLTAAPTTDGASHACATHTALHRARGEVEPGGLLTGTASPLLEPERLQSLKN